jgi:hypothetical protein
VTVKSIRDDKESWPLPGGLNLDGLTYQDLVLHSFPSKDEEFGEILDFLASDRIDWLKLQGEGGIAHPQPWIQLAKLTEAKGDTEGAKQVLFEFHLAQAKRKNVFTRFTAAAYAELEREPFLILMPMLLFWLFGSLIFWRARRMAAMSPTNVDAYDPLTQPSGKSLRYVPFNPAIYALENVLPVVKLGQDTAWAPNPDAKSKSWFPNHKRLGWTRFLPGLDYYWLAIARWTLILLGWGLTLILASAISDHFKWSPVGK